MDYVPQIDLSSSAFNDTDYSELRSKILTSKNKYHDVGVRSDFTYYRTEHYTDDGEQQDTSWKLVVPEGLRDGIMRNVRDNQLSAHGGIAKIAEHIWRFFFQPGLLRSVRHYIAWCETCKTTKHPTKIFRYPWQISYHSKEYFNDFLSNF